MKGCWAFFVERSPLMWIFCLDGRRVGSLPGDRLDPVFSWLYGLVEDVKLGPRCPIAFSAQQRSVDIWSHQDGD